MWQFVGAAVAVLALVVSVLLTMVQRRRKLLDYELLTDTPLLTIREELQGRVKVLLDDRPIQDVSVIVIRLFNRGNLPIRAIEYERPLALSFGDEAQIVSAEITEQVPANQGAELTTEPGRVQLKPVLMNARDSVTLKCLVAGAQAPVVDGRIVGVSAVRRYNSAESPTRLVLSALGAILMVGGMYATIKVATPVKPQPIPPMKPLEIAFFIVANIGGMLMLIPLVPQLRRFLRRRYDRNRSTRRSRAA